MGAGRARVLRLRVDVAGTAVGAGALEPSLLVALMSREEAAAEARKEARRLVAEADAKLHQEEPDEAWLGTWIGQAWATLEWLSREPDDERV